MQKGEYLTYSGRLLCGRGWPQVSLARPFAHLNLALQLACLVRLSPGLGNSTQLRFSATGLCREVSIGNIEDVLGGIRHRRHGEIDGLQE